MALSISSTNVATISPSSVVFTRGPNGLQDSFSITVVASRSIQQGSFNIKLDLSSDGTVKKFPAAISYSLPGTVSSLLRLESPVGGALVVGGSGVVMTIQLEKAISEQLTLTLSVPGYTSRTSPVGGVTAPSGAGTGPSGLFTLTLFLDAGALSGTAAVTVTVSSTNPSSIYFGGRPLVGMASVPVVSASSYLSIPSVWTGSTGQYYTGQTVTFPLSLVTAPSANVVVALGTNSPSVVIISPTSLTFTSANTPQTVTVKFVGPVSAATFTMSATPQGAATITFVPGSLSVVNLVTLTLPTGATLVVGGNSVPVRVTLATPVAGGGSLSFNLGLTGYTAASATSTFASGAVAGAWVSNVLSVSAPSTATLAGGISLTVTGGPLAGLQLTNLALIEVVSGYDQLLNYNAVSKIYSGQQVTVPVSLKNNGQGSVSFATGDATVLTASPSALAFSPSSPGPKGLTMKGEPGKTGTVSMTATLVSSTGSVYYFQLPSVLVAVLLTASAPPDATMTYNGAPVIITLQLTGSITSALTVTLTSANYNLGTNPAPSGTFEPSGSPYLYIPVYITGPRQGTVSGEDLVLDASLSQAGGSFDGVVLLDLLSEDVTLLSEVLSLSW